MNCDEALLAFSESLDGAPLPAAAREHLAACGACREQAAAIEDAHRALLAAPDLAWDQAMTAAVAVRVAAEERRSLLPAVAAAAVLLLATVLAGWAFASGVALPTLIDAADRLLSAVPDLADRAPDPAWIDTLLPAALAVLGAIVFFEAARAARLARGRSRS